MGCFCCLKPKVDDCGEEKPKKAVEAHQANKHLVHLVNTISFAADSYKHRLSAAEILKLGNGDATEPRVFTFAELKEATKSFEAESLLGEGGFGKVYKGHLEDDNQDIAVKQLDRDGLQGNKEFLIEVLMLSLLHHPNLAKLIGYCADGDQRMLVYEYMPNGSLEDHLLDLPPHKKALDWITRMKIAGGAAKGLEYLHDTANQPVIYRDLKASNILLDGEYNSKLSDFGLAKVGPVGGKSHVSTRVMGTYGYCSPEYALTGKLTTMSDVYSFGVVFLEIITGRRAIDLTRPSSEQNLVQWAEPLLKNRKRFAEMADPLLEGNFPKKGLHQALAVAAMCLQEDASTRPVISEVVSALEYLCNPNGDPDGSRESIPMRLTSRCSKTGSKAWRSTDWDNKEDTSHPKENINREEHPSFKREEGESMARC